MKLSSSGKQLQFIDEEGNVYGTSTLFAKGMMEGKSKHGFILLTKMPFKVNKNRFAKSPVYNPDTGEKEVQTEETLTNNNDAFSVKAKEKTNQTKAFKDKVVW